MTPDKLRDTKEKANQFIEKGKLGKAMPLIEQLIMAEPDEPQWHFHLAEAAKQMGRSMQAADEYRRAARAYVRRKDLVRGIAACRLLLEIEPDRSIRELLEDLVRLQALPSGGPGAAIQRAAGVRMTPPVGTAALPSAGTPAAAPAGGAAAALPTQSVRSPDAEPGPLTAIGLQAHLKGTEVAGGTEYHLDEETGKLHLYGGTAGSLESGTELPKIPLFQAIPPEGLAELIRRVEVRVFSPGDLVCHEGEVGRELFVLLRGQVEIWRAIPERVTVQTLGQGDFFGEMSLIADEARTASAEAVTETQALVVPRNVVQEITSRYPNVLTLLLKFFRDRLVQNLVQTSPLFAPLASEDRDQIRSSFKLHEVGAGAEIISLGKQPEFLYVLLAGRVAVYLPGKDGAPRAVAILGPGEVLGEMSMIAGGPAQATVRALKRVWLLAMSRDIFQTRVLAHPRVREHVAELAQARKRANEAMAAPGGQSQDREHAAKSRRLPIV
jgi:CRP-like cAMP-binding protein